MKYSKLSILISISLFITACFDSGTSESEYFVAKSQISEKLLYQHLNASFKNSFESVNTFNDENLDYQILDIQTIYAIKDRCKETLNIEENDYEKDKSFSKRFSYKLALLHKPSL